MSPWRGVKKEKSGRIFMRKVGGGESCPKINPYIPKYKKEG